MYFKSRKIESASEDEFRNMEMGGFRIDQMVSVRRSPQSGGDIENDWIVSGWKYSTKHGMSIEVKKPDPANAGLDMVKEIPLAELRELNP